MLTAADSPGRQVDSPDLAAVTDPVRPHLDALGVFLQEQVSAFEPEIREMVGYCMRHSGKRIRPLLVFFGGWTVEDAGASAPPDPDRVRAAAVVELIHLATLVHDDILDGATIRHGCHTVSERYGTNVAVLLGDALFAHALKLASDFPVVDICRAVSEATRQVCSGEISQTLQRGNPELGLEAYLRIIDLKTAELFRVSAQLGARLAGHPPAFVEAVGAFGRHLGIAYQIYDDLADFLGREEHIGKTLGTDLESGKFTLPLILLLEEIPAEERAAFVARVLASGAEGVPALNRDLAEGGAFAATHRFFQREIDAASGVLDPFDDLPPAGPLRAIARFVGDQAGGLVG